MIIVSIKGSNIATSPSETGCLVLAEACAIGALPCPASLEKSPRPTPLLNAKEREAPRKPPVAADPEKTPSKIAINDGMIFSAL